MQRAVPDEEKPLLAKKSVITTSDGTTYKLTPLRWFILFTFSFAAFNQCMLWVTFSPVSDLSEQYFEISAEQVQFLLTIGPLIFIPSAFLMLLFTQSGLRKIVFGAVTLELLCGLLRCIPCIWEKELIKSHGAKNDYGIALIYIAQILNAICGPLVLSSPSLVSQTWFGESERTLTTAIAALATSLGSAAGFLLAPYCVTVPDEIPRLIFVHAILAAIPFICVLIYFPNLPPDPPSLSALRLQEKHEKPSDVFTDLFKAGFDKEVLLFSLGGGFYSGAFYSWTGVISTIVRPYGYTDEYAGWLGFSATIASMIGGLMASFVADKYFEKNFKILIVWLLILCTIFVVWFTLSLPSAWWDSSILTESKSVLLISITGTGFFLGCALPLMFEFLIDLTYPFPESSGILLTTATSLGSLAFLCVPPDENKSMNLFMLFSGVISIILIILTKERYGRSEVDKPSVAP
eukprot:c19967_g1_i1.p1 GENE.c19967_g1_i1~~c19967_g1_i1.p1  ORF type:complete len:462 (+),score=197.26 c19967_g1_i1:2-1387(+)